MIGETIQAVVAICAAVPASWALIVNKGMVWYPRVPLLNPAKMPKGIEGTLMLNRPRAQTTSWSPDDGFWNWNWKLNPVPTRFGGPLVCGQVADRVGPVHVGGGRHARHGIFPGGGHLDIGNASPRRGLTWIHGIDGLKDQTRNTAGVAQDGTRLQSLHCQDNSCRPLALASWLSSPKADPLQKATQVAPGTIFRSHDGPLFGGIPGFGDGFSQRGKGCRQVRTLSWQLS